MKMNSIRLCQRRPSRRKLVLLGWTDENGRTTCQRMVKAFCDSEQGIEVHVAQKVNRKLHVTAKDFKIHVKE